MNKNFTQLTYESISARCNSALTTTLFLFMLLMQANTASAQTTPAAPAPTPTTQSVCVGTSATFTASYTGTANNNTPQSNYTVWQHSTDNFATVTTLTPTSFIENGNFKVTTTLTLSGANLKSGQYRVVYRRNNNANVAVAISSAATLTVTNKPEATITTNTPLAFCSSKENVKGYVDLNANLGTGLSYEWRRVGSSTVLGTGSTYQATTSGSYQVTVSNNPGCSTISLPITVRVIQTPTATVTVDNSTPTTFCTGNNVVLRAAATFGTDPAPGSFRNYTWYDSNRKTSEGTDLAVGNDITFPATQTGNYYVVITNAEEVANSDGTTSTVISCPSVPSASVPVTVYPYPEAAISAPITSTCPGRTVTLTATTTGATYRWFLNNTLIENQNGPTLEAGATGSYGVEVTTNGCIDRTEPSEEVVVTILSPTTVIEGITVANQVVYFCAGTSKSLTAVAGTGYTYQWYQKATAPNTTDILVSNERIFPVSQAGIYYVVIGVPATDGNCPTTSVNVDVRQATAITDNTITPPTVAILCYNTAPTSPIEGSTAIGGDGIISYTWERRTENGDFTPIPGASGINFKDYTPGVLTQTTYFRRIATSLCDSEPTAAVKITVNPLITGNIIAATATAICTTSPETITIGQSSTDVLSGGDGTFTDFQWESSINGSTFTPIAGATDASYSYTPDVLTQTTHYRRRVRSGNCTSTSGPLTITVNQPPTASAGSSQDQILCSTMASLGYTEFTLDGLGQNADFEWTVVLDSKSANIGDVTIEDPARLNSSVRVVGTGTITLQLTAKSNTTPTCGDPVVSTVELTVNPAPTASATLAGNELPTRCIQPNTTGTVFQLRGTGTNGTSAWSVVPELSTTTAYISNVANPEDEVITASATVNGTGTVTLRLTTTSNINPDCNVATADVVLTVNPLPTATAAVAANEQTAKCVQPGTTGTTFRLDGKGANGTFKWTQESNTPGASVTFAPNTDVLLNPTVTFNGIGTVTLLLTTTSEVGCGDPVTSEIKLSVNETPQLTLGNFPTALCTTSPAFVLPGSFTGSTDNANVSYTYRNTQTGAIGNPGAISLNNGVYYLDPSKAGSGTWQVTYTVERNGCISTVNKNFLINTTPAPPTYNLRTGTTNIIPGALIFTGEGAKNLIGSPADGTFEGFGVINNTTFNPYTAFNAAVADYVKNNPGTDPNSITQIPVSITYTVQNNGGCTNSTTQTYTIKKSVYSVVVFSTPKPFCNGVNVDHVVRVYRDVQSIEYPYLVNSENQPVDANGNLIPNGEDHLPVGNPLFSATRNAPQVVKENAYRFYNPIVTLGTGVEITTGITQQWTKNHKVFVGGDAKNFGNAGLSSQEYYAADVTVDLSSGEPDFSRTSTRAYTGGLPDYNISLVTSPRAICPGSSINFITTLDTDFANWNDIGLDITWILTRGNTTTTLRTLNNYAGNIADLQFTMTGPPSGGTFMNGDQVSIIFNSDITNYYGAEGTESRQKCGGNVTSNIETITVAQPITISSSNGAYCANVNGVTITTANRSQTGILYQLLNAAESVVTAQSGNGNFLTFLNIKAGTYTVRLVIPAQAAVPATATTPARPATPEAICSSSNPVTIIETPLPLEFNVSGGGPYCAGQNGVTITLSNSEAGIRYTLLRNGVVVRFVDRTVGGTFSFLEVKDAGTYTVGATTIASQPTVAGCLVPMKGSVNVSINQLPVSPGFANVSYCLNALSTPLTATGVQLKWYSADGTALSGAPTPATSTVGTTRYFVSQTNSNGCEGPRAEILVTVYALPVPPTAINQQVCPNGASIPILTATAKLPVNSPDGTTIIWYTTELGNETTTTPTLQEVGSKTYYAATQNPTYCISPTRVPVTLTILPQFNHAVFLTGPEESVVAYGGKATYTATTFLSGTEITDQVGTRFTYEWTVSQQIPGVAEPTVTHPTTPKNVLVINPVEGILTVSVKCIIKDGTCVNDKEPTATSERYVPLPVELIYLKADKQDKNVVKVEWATAKEEDNKGFEVQVSQDAKNYRTLSFVPTQNGNTLLRQVYTFYDKEDGKKGTRYYRLKQMDMNGDTKYFGPKAVKMEQIEEPTLAAYPNPFTSEVNLEFTSEESGTMLVEVTSALGAKVYEKTLKVEKGFRKETIQLSPNMANGVYIITTRLGDKTNHIRLMKQL